tara:strand:+ start:844 stop:2052 length:1209 start_codon:yes stop_codon:yes gene_type:complete
LKAIFADYKTMNILIYGAGYVGLSLASVLSKKFNISVIDTDRKKVQKIKNNLLPFNDSNEKILKQSLTKIKIFCDDSSVNFRDLDFVLICVPTNFDYSKTTFDVSIIEKILKDLLGKDGKFSIVIKSTVPIGFTERISRLLDTTRIIFSPEFLREGFAINDNLLPSKIVAGALKNSAAAASKFLGVMKKICINDDVKLIKCTPTEAESIKLFSNTYLAMRVAFFNELDSFCYTKNLNTRSIIDSLCTDPRIGSDHNNPSFGYGGYCLPKDSKQLENNFADIPQEIISSVITSNRTRKKFIYKKTLETGKKRIGIYRLSMKKGSDNFRESAVVEIIEMLKKHDDIKLTIYEPLIKDDTFSKIEVSKNLEEFKKENDLILSNRISADLYDIKEKVLSRDIYGKD